MDNEFFRIFIPNPDDVIYELLTCNLKYPPNNRAYDWVFARTAVFPFLYKYVVQSGQIPKVVTTGSHLVKTCTDWEQASKNDKEAIKNRALKLTMDFYRDLHTMGLLSLKFASVVYERGLDISYNVDYKVTLKKHLFAFMGNNAILNTPIGIASAMQHPRNWRNPESFIAIKQRRRNKRGHKEWEGDIFWLTNQTRPFWRKANGVWLFGAGHINDLIEDIKGHYHSDSKDTIAINIQPTLFD